MSKVSRFGKPACTATQSAPVTPPAGPVISRLTGKSSADFADARPPSERRMCSLTLFASGVELALQVVHVLLHARAHVGVGDRRHGALVLLHLGHDFRRERHRDVRQHLLGDLPDAALVRVVGEGVDQRDGERLDASSRRARAGPSRSFASSSWCTTSPCALDALVGLDRQRERRHRQRLVVDDPAAEAARHEAARDLQHLPVALGRHEADACAGAGQHGVGGDRRAVHHVLDLFRRDARAACRRARCRAARRPTGRAACSDTLAFQVWPVFSFTSSRSVKVPPTSTPNRYVMQSPVSWSSWDRPGLPNSRGSIPRPMRGRNPRARAGTRPCTHFRRGRTREVARLHQHAGHRPPELLLQPLAGLDRARRATTPVS